MIIGALVVVLGGMGGLCDTVGLVRFRHTIASRLEQLGVPAATRAALLGHTIQVHLDVYTMTTEDQLADAAEAFGKSFSGLAVVDGTTR